MACTVVQTPQMRCVNAQASRGSRPLRMISMPRNIVDEDQAFCTTPLIHLGFDAQVPFDAGDRIDDDVGHDASPSPRRGGASASSSAGAASFPSLRRASSPRPCAPKAAPTPAAAQTPTRSMFDATAEARDPGEVLVERASSCPRSRARRSRCRDGRSRSASWCRRSSARWDSSGTSPAPCSPSCRGSSRCGGRGRPTLRRTGRRRSGRAAHRRRGSSLP